MKGMHYLKENNRLAVALFTLAMFFLSFFYLDTLLLFWAREFKVGKSFLYTLIDTAYPFIRDASNGLSFIAIIIGFFLLARLYNKGLYETGTSLCIGFAATGIATQLLKHMIGRARPKIADTLIIIGPTWKSKYDSFPSGHTAVAFCFAYILSAYYPKYRVLFYLLAMLVGAGRLKVPSHFLSDVMAGAVLGLFIGKATLHYVKLFMDRKRAAKSPVI